MATPKLMLSQHGLRMGLRLDRVQCMSGWVIVHCLPGNNLL